MRSCLVLIYLVVNLVHGVSKSGTFFTVSRASSRQSGAESQSQSVIRTGSHSSKSRIGSSKNRLDDEPSVSLERISRSRSHRNSGTFGQVRKPTWEERFKRLLESDPAQALIQLATSAATIRGMQEIEDRIYGSD